MTRSVPMPSVFRGDGGAVGGIEGTHTARQGARTDLSSIDEKSMTPAAKAIAFLERLEVPEGPLAGRRLTLAPFQKRFVEGALADVVSVAALSIGRGNAKTALSAGLALGALLGTWDNQPRREIPIAARTRDQARVAWNFCVAFARSLPDDIVAQLEFRRQPRYEIEYTGDGGGHVLRAIAADGKSALGMSPTFALLDERGHWLADQGPPAS